MSSLYQFCLCDNVFIAMQVAMQVVMKIAIQVTVFALSAGTNQLLF